MKNNSVVIIKHANRKLYTLNESRYITLPEIFKLMKDKNNITVFDKKTRKDITEITKLNAIYDSLTNQIEVDNVLLNKVINLLES